MTLRLLWMTIALATVPPTLAWAQDAGKDDAGTTQAIDPAKLELDGDGVEPFIGRSNCAAETAKTLTLDGELGQVVTDDGYKLRIFVETGTDCTNEDYAECDRGAADLSACRCLFEGAAGDSDISVTTTLGAHFPDGELCVDGQNEIVKFLLVYYLPATDDTSEVITVADGAETYTIDLDPPGRMTGAPAIRVGENAFGLTRGGTAEEAETYEVCFVPRASVGPELQARLCESSATATDAGVTDDTPLPASVTCASAGTWGGEYNTGQVLQNSVEYLVSSRALDEAGNAGDFGPCARGTPVSVQDFAEYYAGLNGAETGGCGVGSGPANRVALWLAAASTLAFALRRRRSR